MDEATQLRARTKKFAIDVIKLVRSLPYNRECKVIGDQRLRSATSVGANYRAVCRSRSGPDFISKMGVILEEADESGFWLELLRDAGVLRSDNVEVLLREANELTAIFAASRITAQRNLKS